MKPKTFFLVLQFFLCFQIGCSEISRSGPEKFFSNNQTKIRSIYSLYDKLNRVTPFELSCGNTSAIQVFWDTRKSSVYYNNLENVDLINFLDSNGVDKKDFFSLIALMKEIKCKYVSASYLNGESVYIILGFNNGVSLKDLQYIFFSGDIAEDYFKKATNLKQVTEKIYFKYSKKPGD